MSVAALEPVKAKVGRRGFRVRVTRHTSQSFLNLERIAGIDVSAKQNHLLIRTDRKQGKGGQFDNTAKGHNQVIRALQKAHVTQVCLEATGLYHLDLAVAIDKADHLIEHRGLKKIQAVCAVMRKLLHAIHGMLKSRTAFDSSRFYTAPTAATR